MSIPEQKKIPEYEFDEEPYVALEDHLAATASLIERIQNLQSALLRCRKREDAQSRAVSRQARWDADYVPYGEDERD